MRITAKAPAKLNLSLLVGPRRADGYHELFTVFVPIDLHDELSFFLALTEGGLTVSCEGVDGDDNLVARALHALAEASGRPISGEVVVRKGIPVGAGLGGGSSDAALALRVGARLLAEDEGMEIESERLHGLAARLGADVPFFLGDGPALARGIGERLEPFALPVLPVVLVMSTDTLSTPSVYRTFDKVAPTETMEEFSIRAHACERDWRACARQCGGRVAELLRNDLEQASFSLLPHLVEDKRALVEAGALGALMSGSGPTLFGLCRSAEAAQTAAQRLAARGYTARAASTLLSSLTYV